jgi:hypothetical protein
LHNKIQVSAGLFGFIFDRLYACESHGDGFLQLPPQISSNRLRILPDSINRCLTLSRSSLAALLVKVVPTAPAGAARPSVKAFSSSCVIRKVFPLPAPALMNRMLVFTLLPPPRQDAELAEPVVDVVDVHPVCRRRRVGIRFGAGNGHLHQPGIHLFASPTPGGLKSPPEIWGGFAGGRHACQRIVKKNLLSIRGVLLDAINPLQDLGQIYASIFLHNGLASLRIRRRMSQ